MCLTQWKQEINKIIKEFHINYFAGLKIILTEQKSGLFLYTSFGARSHGLGVILHKNLCFD